MSAGGPPEPAPCTVTASPTPTTIPLILYGGKRDNEKHIETQRQQKFKMAQGHPATCSCPPLPTPKSAPNYWTQGAGGATGTPRWGCWGRAGWSRAGTCPWGRWQRALGALWGGCHPLPTRAPEHPAVRRRNKHPCGSAWTGGNGSVAPGRFLMQAAKSPLTSSFLHFFGGCEIKRHLICSWVERGRPCCVPTCPAPAGGTWGCDTPGTEPPGTTSLLRDTLGTHLPATVTLLVTRSLQRDYGQGLVPMMPPHGGAAPRLLPIQPIQGTLLPQCPSGCRLGALGAAGGHGGLPWGPCLCRQMAL